MLFGTVFWKIELAGRGRERARIANIVSPARRRRGEN